MVRFWCAAIVAVLTWVCAMYTLGAANAAEATGRRCAVAADICATSPYPVRCSGQAGPVFLGITKFTD